MRKGMKVRKEKVPDLQGKKLTERDTKRVKGGFNPKEIGIDSQRGVQVKGGAVPRKK